VTLMSVDRPVSSEQPALWGPTRGFWILSGVLLLGLNSALVLLSSDFGFALPLLQQPVAWFVGMELAAGVVFLAVVWASSRGYSRNVPVVWVIFVGMAMRCLMMCSSPVLEYDYYRYLWDGAVLAHGMNPFRYAPAQVTDPTPPVPAKLRTLARESAEILPKINHPELRTIYPPVAQVAFAAAHLIRPWSLGAWRCVLAFFDAATVLLLLGILRRLGYPGLLVVIYWWNPLVIREIFNTGHMDVVVLPFALAALMLSTRGRNLCASSALALAVGGKVWPLVLLPVVLSPMWRRPRELLLSLAIFGVMVLLLCAPVCLSGLDNGSGFVSYGLHWRVNESLFRVLSFCIGLALEVCYWDSAEGYMVTRIVAVVLMCGWVGWQCRSIPHRPVEWWERSLLIVTAAFLLSPTGFPWYYLWVVPFLAIRPRPSLVLLNCLLPLYYLVFYFRGRQDGHFFDSVIVWFEYIPVAVVCLWERITSTADRRDRR
jgi:alpha-1,6-mannosyltransferase